MNFTFVILNYKNYTDTVECIDSILNNINYENKNIVLVDNASNDETFERIRKKYKENRNIFCIENKENLGFAKGNNVGFQFAKYNLKADFICLLNNDTIIKQLDFIDKCIDIYRENKYFVIGPNIISTIDGKNQNPHGGGVPTLKYVLKNIVLESILYVIARFPKIYDRFRMLKSKSIVENKQHDIILENVKLHGSCMIFSPMYVEKKDGLFSKTFMYGEEDILFYQCNKEKMKIIYSPYIYIYHKEGSSTKSSLNNNDIKKRIFYYKNRVRSSIELLKLMIRN